MNMFIQLNIIVISAWLDQNALGVKIVVVIKKDGNNISILNVFQFL